jgi:hypothetical protein
MKNKIFTLAFTLVASTAFAQTGFNPYRIDMIRPACYDRLNPYHMTTEQFCHVPEIEGGKPHVVYTVVQGSVGIFGREITFLNLVNATDEINHVTLEYVIDGKPGTFYHDIHLRAKERYPIALHMDQEFSGAWNFSVIVKFQRSGNMEMVWYRASDNMEVDSKVGQEVR